MIFFDEKLWFSNLTWTHTLLPGSELSRLMKNKNIFFSRKNSNTEESFWSPHIKISAMDRSASTTFHGFYFFPSIKSSKWLISINVPVSLLLLVTCLFFLRVEYNDFNFSSEWGLAGLDQNQPRPDISKNEKIIGMHHLNWSLLNQSESIHFWSFDSSLIVQRGASSQWSSSSLYCPCGIRTKWPSERRIPLYYI